MFAWIRCALIVVLTVHVSGYTFQSADHAVGHGHLREVHARTASSASKLAAAVPQVPEPPLPAAGSPVEVPLVGSKKAHTADPAICGILGGLIVLGWVVGCCCAGGAGAAGASGSESGAAAGAGQVDRQHGQHEHEQSERSGADAEVHADAGSLQQPTEQPGSTAAVCAWTIQPFSHSQTTGDTMIPLYLNTMIPT